MAFAEIRPLANPPKRLKDPEDGRELTYRALWARLLVRDQLAREVNILQSMPLDESPDRLWQLPPTGLSPWTRDNLPPRLIPQENIVKKGFKLCIVGAGMAGLYIALILDTLDIPGISFDFFEASDRIGGRCFTHEFSKIPHDYYDVGAMRFPDIPVMAR
jgi:NAD(P)-binding Rossmann-like domain